MEKLQKTIKGMVGKVLNEMSDKDAREWPPQCGFFAYQPKRPMRCHNEESDKETHKNV